MRSFMILPVFGPDRPSEPAPPVADDLGKMWGREPAEDAADGASADPGAAGAGPGAPDRRAGMPSSADPRERREIGEAVADLDNPADAEETPADVSSGGDDDDRAASAAGPVTGSWA